ncbi:hypothetical protein [Enterococcus innesii]|uniref:hypothetical protein n=1 Tax=Enterococcus innesii TaxID=2839759 RepID=UPI0023302332|nr:hypothetical protein [Enterococcus innesii]MDC0753122.1 hypothetical protein [Enterococcus innesii]MDC0777211.1 hypothetical protein [Enterococcus innesii]MDC0780798.1 hypothetical protein [Enterococcus innesii]MDC0783958.1 hypothetical protein [Enterococcus innesii]
MTAHGRKFVVRTRDSHVASDIELRNLVNIVEENPADTFPLSPGGSVAISLNNYVVKLSNDHYLVFDDNIFHQIFSISRK